MERIEAHAPNICRTCSCSKPEMRPIFTSPKTEERNLSEVLNFVINIQVDPDDVFSKQICEDCEVSLRQMDVFKRRCIENEAKLQALYQGPFLPSGEIKIKEEGLFKPYQCSLCYVRYSDVYDLQSHVAATHKKEDKSVVEISVEESKVKTEVEDSIDFSDQFADNTIFEESNCAILKVDEETEQVTLQKCSKKEAKSIQKSEIARKCKICDKIYKNQHSYRKHMRRIHNEGSAQKNQLLKYECSQCMQKFKQKSTLITHLRTHNSTGLHICLLCKREFKHKAHLDNHILSIHTTQDGHKCESCDKSFPTIESLEIHQTSHEGTKKHVCNVCSKSFYMLSTLKDHVRVHTGERPYLCPTCGKGFTQNTNLQEHLRRHAGIKPFGCEICPRRFVAKGELSAHMRKHSGAHPFVCVECGGGFTTSSSLVKHRRTHTGERPYACDLCDMRFAASGTLKNHRRTHTGEKPYKCTHCDKAFVQKNDLVSHTRCHTGERPYVCPTCGQAFRQSSALKTHLKIHQH